MPAHNLHDRIANIGSLGRHAMFKIVSIVAINLVWLGDPAWAWQKTLFMHCQTRSAAKLSDAGAIETDAMGQNIEFTVDVQSGAVRLKYASEAMQWIILRSGDAENDIILVGQTTNPSRMADIILRIRDWSSRSTITFMKIVGVAISTGTCNPL